jgi:hypothetical protein
MFGCRFTQEQEAGFRRERKRAVRDPACPVACIAQASGQTKRWPLSPPRSLSRGVLLGRASAPSPVDRRGLAPQLAAVIVQVSAVANATHAPYGTSAQLACRLTGRMSTTSATMVVSSTRISMPASAGRSARKNR